MPEFHDILIGDVFTKRLRSTERFVKTSEYSYGFKGEDIPVFIPLIPVHVFVQETKPNARKNRNSG